MNKPNETFKFILQILFGLAIFLVIGVFAIYDYKTAAILLFVAMFFYYSTMQQNRLIQANKEDREFLFNRMNYFQDCLNGVKPELAHVINNVPTVEAEKEPETIKVDLPGLEDVEVE